MIHEVTTRKFQTIIWDYYSSHGRHDLPWRQVELNGEFEPFKILVSEVMLQQTQARRVIPKYQEFLEHFPSILHLAASPQSEVLRAWSGLGYNRRAQYLHQAAKRIMIEYKADVPSNSEELIQLPGIGPNTAGAIMAYAFNQPVSFIETNIRSVYIHHFFARDHDVSDRAIFDIIEQTIDTRQPRKWYWALTDYGSYLKQTTKNPSQQSKHYVRQSKFVGSHRQLRGQVLRMLSERPQTKTRLQEYINDERLSDVLSELLKENLITRRGTQFSL